jgi:hypothetical protein
LGELKARDYSSRRKRTKPIKRPTSKEDKNRKKNA